MTDDRAMGALWRHQREAVEATQGYFADGDVDRESMLITMPTGTGKTGVIAAITTCLPEVTGHRLVLTPWDALVRQLIVDLRERFWSRLPQARRPTPLPVKRLPPASKLSDIESDEPTIYVATVSAISVAASVENLDLPAIFAEFGCVIVDEGHYEPAKNWSMAIRSLRRPTVLLTATPYRNDRKFFHVKDWQYRLSHHDAERRGYLRKPLFETVPWSVDPAAFARQVLDVVQAKFADSDEVRIIVRCATDSTIIEMVRAFRELGEESVGVHEAFAGTGGEGLQRSVPRTDECNARIWVHQNKLIEGIDDPRFKVLAFYDPLTNGRAIIQQIGRILRRPVRSGDADRTALVLTRGDRRIQQTWNSYRVFDKQPHAGSAATLPDLVKAILEAQTFYYEGAYRSPIDPTAPKPWEDFAFPLRTRVFRRATTGAVDLDALARAIHQEHVQQDRMVFDAEPPDERTRIMSLVRPENSPYVRNAAFIEPRFGYTVFRVYEDLLFFYDTAGITPEVIKKSFRPLRPPELQVLFPKDRTQLTSVALLNTDIGDQAPRSRRFRASAIENLAPDLADYAYSCTIAEGYTEIHNRRFRRYVGISRSRISDFRSDEGDFAAYSQWLDGLHAELTTSTTTAAVFGRYATYVDPPAIKDVEHILIDVDPSRFSRVDNEGNMVVMDIPDRAATVYDGRFALQVNGEQYGVAVAWNSEHQRYELRSPALQFLQFQTRRGDPDELIRAINGDQLLRIVPHGRTTIYAHGSFYKPIIPATKPGAFQLLDVLYPVPALETVKSEKGSIIENDDWQDDCVFGKISALAPGNPRQAPTAMSDVISAPDLILCTDLQKEVADFVVTEAHRVVFVHAKSAPLSKDATRCSASALHDVASQAIKNLTHLQPMSVTPLDQSVWEKPWSAAPHVSGSTTRLRHGSFDSAGQMWEHIQSRIQAPGTDREVWLTLGRTLSKDYLLKQATKQSPAPEAIQVFALLQATWGAVSQLGGRLRIFCSP